MIVNLQWNDTQAQHWTLNQIYERMGDINFWWGPQESCVYHTCADVNYIYCQCLFVKLVDNINYYFLHPAYYIVSGFSVNWGITAQLGEEDVDITERKFILYVYFLFKNSESECFFFVTEINIFSSYQSTGFSGNMNK